jgi:hypothetical protein
MPNSYIEYTSGLTETTFSIPFKYISIDDIQAIGFDGEKYVPLTISSRSGSDKTITLSAAPSALYTKLRVYRSTSTAQLVDFQNGSRLSERDLDTAYQQGLFTAQEIAEDASTTQFAAVREVTILAGTSLANFASEAFTGDGTSTVFDITAFNTQTIVSEAYRVSIDGVMQSPIDAYSISMNPSKITFASAPPSGSNIIVVTAASAASATSVDDVTIGLTSTNQVKVKASGVGTTQIAPSSVTFSKLTDVNDDDTMSNASATTLATSESIKAYVDGSFQVRAGCVYNGVSNSLSYSNGVSGVVRNSTGRYTVTLSNAAPSSPFPVFANALPSSTAPRNLSIGVRPTSTTTIDVEIEDSNGTAEDLNSISIIALY